MTLVRIAFVTVAGALVVAFTGVGLPDSAHSASDPARTVTVSGRGSVTAVPDRAHFSFGVENRGRTASEAMAANSVAMQKVIDALVNTGVSRRDLQTQQVSLSPVYSDGGDSLIGYTASNTVGLTIRQLGQAGQLVDKAVAAGANQVYGPSLDRADRDALYRKALEAAVAEARAKAETIASSSGLTLGRPTAVQESTESAPVPYADARASAVSGTPIEQGTTEIEANVTVTYAAS